MKATFDLKAIQNMNLFERITGVKARYCFDYNFIRIFIVPRKFIGKALGERAVNIKKLERSLFKKTRIIAEPEEKNQEEMENFVSAIIYPYGFKKIEVVYYDKNHEKEVQIFSMPRIKAALIGRNKTRLEEISKILDQFFGIKKVVIK